MKKFPRRVAAARHLPGQDGDPLRLKPLTVLLRQALAVAACAQLPLGVQAAAPVPGARIPVTALPTGAVNSAAQVGNIGGRVIYSPQVVTGAVSAYQVTTNPNGSVTGTVTQTSNAAILQWQKFDIGANATLNVAQPSTNAVLLNKVSSGDVNGSTIIEGRLNANGQVYIYNPNGIIFGKTSQVNVNTLVASTLKIDDKRFTAGLIAPNASPIFAKEGTAAPGDVIVEGERTAAGVTEQAQINAARGGKILLIGNKVSNEGRLSAPDGQVLAAAAADSVYLSAPTDVRMRGLVVEVVTGGTVTNEALGKILVERGNASLVGAAVNQNGRISATTSVQANGSIFLRAQSGAEKGTGSPLEPAVATRSGKVVLGENSVTEVQPDLADTTTAPKSSFNPSQILIAGESVRLSQNAQVLAPGGEVAVFAQTNPKERSVLGITGGKIGDRGVYLEAGARIDVSGTTTTELAMESNVIAVELRGTELADVPLQRNSAIRGRTVYVDRRRGTPAANVQGYLDLREFNVGESTAAGGTVTLNADQEVIVAEGARINVSGGVVSYRSGYVATTQLLSGNFSVDIGSASPDRIYTGLSAPVAGPRNFEMGYSEGLNAGSVRFNAPSLLLRGELSGNVSPGARQRDVSAAAYPQGGELVIGAPSRIDSAALGNTSNFSFLGNIDFGGRATEAITTPKAGDTWDSASAASQTLRSTADIDPAMLVAGGFTRINAYSRTDTRVAGDSWGTLFGSAAVSVPVTLKPGGEFRLATEGALSINANIMAPGGTVEAVSNALLTVSSGLSLDVAGLWTNDRSAGLPLDAAGNPIAPVVTKGGSISLSGKGSADSDNWGLKVGAGTRFDASAGAWQNTAGKIAGGSGGSISVVSSAQDATTPNTAGLELGYAVDFRAYSLNKGGSVKLGARNVVIQKDPANAIAPYLTDLITFFGPYQPSAPPSTVGIPVNLVDLAVSASWFGRGGFSRYDVSATGNLTVAEGASIAARADNWVSNRATATQSNGRMSGVFDITTLPLGSAQGARSAAGVSLTAAAKLVDGSGRLWLQKGAVIAVDPGAAVTLSGGRQVTVDGRITAPSGTVSVLLTPDLSDPTLSYRPERSIWLGASARIDAGASSAQLWNNSSGLTQGELPDGGAIRIGRASATDLAPAQGFVAVEKGAVLNVTGGSASMTLPGGRGTPETRQIVSAGGSIDIRARDGLFVDGTLSGGGGGVSASGGSVNLVLDGESSAGAAGSPAVTRNLTVLSRKLNAGTANEIIVPSGLKADQPLGANDVGQGYVLAGALSGGGFDRILLKSQDRISFDAAAGNVSLSARADIQVDAPVIAARNASSSAMVSLSAAHVGLGNSDWRYQGAGASAAALAGGGATLKADATAIDLFGTSTLDGFSSAALSARQDIRLSGVVAEDLSVAAPAQQTTLHAVGHFQVAGGLTLSAAQVYPTTLSEFSLTASGAGGQVNILGNGASANMPLSAAGTLTVNAETINQNGVLRAPFGSISLISLNKLTYGPGSLTSLSGSGTVPLGRVDNGRNWLYDFGNGHVVNLGDSSASNAYTLPGKKLVSTAANIEVAKGAVIDVSGGGDLYAYEFTAGPGGSRDVLAKGSNTSASPVYAIKPGYETSFAPLDFQYQQDAATKPGDRIYLSGIPGLTAGYYTLLPAHYALLPGAFTVSAASGNRDMAASNNIQRPDGSWLVAGARGSAVASDSRTSGFIVTSSDQVRTQSQFSDYSGNTFFTTTGAVPPKSGGHLVFSTSASLALGGTMYLRGAGDGSRGIADFSAPEIQIVSESGQGTSGAVKLLADDLSALGADSVLIGGVRDVRRGGVQVAVGANNVTLQNDVAHPLTGSEVILAAKDRLRIESGGLISSSGVPDTYRGDLLITGSGTGADGALLRVSGGAQAAVVRNAPSGATGTLNIANGAVVRAAGSMNLDATKSFGNQSTLGLGAQAALGIGANRITLGDAAPITVDGLRIGGDVLSALNGLSNLSLTSYTTFDVYGTAALGTQATRTLNLRGAGIQSYGTTGSALTLTADAVRFDGGGTFVPAGLAAVSDGSAGQFTVSSAAIDLGDGAFAVKGFKNSALEAQQEIRAVGKGTTFSTERELTLTTRHISVGSGSDALFKAGGAMTLAKATNVPASASTDGLGGTLTFVANAIVSDVDITARAGQIALLAQGTDGVSIRSGWLNASGASRNFGTTLAYAPGGSIRLDGGNGKVLIDAPATLDVSATGAEAGDLSIKAGLSASVNGTLKGGANDSQTQGRFALDVGSAGNPAQWTALNAKLNTSGFTELRAVRVRMGDIVIEDTGPNSSTIVSRQVTLAADNGNVTVAGTVDASGAKGGRIEIFAGQTAASGHAGNVTLASTARLLANATEAAASSAGSNGDGGSVLIGVGAADGLAPAAISGNRIALEGGSSINVSGLGAGGNGRITLRAPRVGSGGGSDVAITAVNATLEGGGVATIEAYKVYNGTAIGAAADSTSNLQVADATGAPAGRMYTEAVSFMGNAAGILNRLGQTTARLSISPGVEVRSSGDLTVSVNETAAAAQNRGWNLNAWRFGANADQPGVLTLRAANNLIVNGSISDGFIKSSSRIAMPGWTLDPSGNASWSYRLAGGADFSAANPMGVLISDTKGDVTLTFARTANTTNDQPVSLLRTGTGQIAIAAGRDVALGSTTVSLPDPTNRTPTVQAVLGATIYTAGRFAALESGFLPPNNQTINSIYTNGVSTRTTASFGIGGGSVGIDAGRDVTGIATRQMINNWLFRRGRVTTDANGNTVFGGPVLTDGNTNTTRYESVLTTGWWTRYDYFNQGVATFGGGDIAVTAGRNVNNVSLSVASSGQVPGAGTQQNLPTSLVERGGGDIQLRAGADVRGGGVYVQKGNAYVRAAGAIVAGDNIVNDPELGAMSLRPVLALGDGKINLSATGNVEIEAAFNPTLVQQNSWNADATNGLRRQSPLSYFSTYGADSALNLTSLAGDVVLGNHSLALNIAATPWQTAFDGNASLVYPSSLKVSALTGSFVFNNGFSLWPSATGQLDLLAAESVVAAYPRLQNSGLNATGAQPIVMIDAAPAALPNVLAPLSSIGSVASVLNPVTGTAGLASHTEGGLHANDLQPIRIAAINGDILGESFFGGAAINNTLISAKPVEMLAGRDIKDFGFTFQHLRENDVSTIVAGRDFIDTTFSNLSPVRHYVSGPGRLDITAGGSIDLGTSRGIVTRGNLDNPYLPDTGAGINLVAGAKADYAEFVTRHVSATDLPARLQTALVSYVKERNAALPDNLGVADALVAFNALPLVQRERLLTEWKSSFNDIFFGKLRTVTGSTGGGVLDLAAFDDVIASLFPLASISKGDINVFGSQLKTARGGSINVFAPGGSVQAGLAERPAWVKLQLASDKTFESNLGIYTVAGGNLQSLVNNNFLVNQGRVFTLGGGDITLVSQYGNIDAGKGAKTAQSTPPPLIRTDAQGNTVVDISASISGSGIATLRTGLDVPASSVYPIAPRGIFDAGDAGVRSTGSVNIVAQTVLNANNISASGSVSGAKTVDSSGLATASAPASATPVAKTDAFSNPPQTDANAAASLTVELLGFGAVDSQESVIQGGQNSSIVEPDEKLRK